MLTEISLFKEWYPIRDLVHDLANRKLLHVKEQLFNGIQIGIHNIICYGYHNYYAYLARGYHLMPTVHDMMKL